MSVSPSNLSDRLMPDAKGYERLAKLFQYPTAALTSDAETAQAWLDAGHPESAAMLRPFTSYLRSAALVEMEEIFTRSFEVQAITTLDIGYVMFGDDYKRAELLVNLNREHQDAGNDCYSELPDHLPNVLRLIVKMKDRELAQELVERILGPAVARMKAEFTPERLEKKNKLYQKHHRTIIALSESYGLLYGRVLEALYAVLQCDFGLREPPPIKQTDTFLRSVENEMKLEKE